MSFETVVVEELRNLDGDHFRVTLWTSEGNIVATLRLAAEIPRPKEWTIGDWSDLVSEVEDARPEGAADVGHILRHVAYRLSRAAFVNVPSEDRGEGVDWSSGGGASGVTVEVLRSPPIPVKVYAHEGAGDDDTPLRTWVAEITDRNLGHLRSRAARSWTRRSHGNQLKLQALTVSEYVAPVDLL